MYQFEVSFDIIDTETGEVLAIVKDILLTREDTRRIERYADFWNKDIGYAVEDFFETGQAKRYGISYARNNQKYSLTQLKQLRV